MRDWVRRLTDRLYGRRYGMVNRTLAWPVALILTVALMAFGAFYTTQLRFNSSSEVYYAADAPAIVLRDALRKDFPSDEVLTLVFKGSNLYGHDFLRRLGKFEAEMSKHPLVDRVIAITSAEKISSSSDGFSVSPLIDLRNINRTPPAELQRRVLGDRFAAGTLASRDGQYLALGIRPKALSGSLERLELQTAAFAAVTRSGLRGQFVGDAGPVSLDVATLRSILRDTAIFVPLTVIIGLTLLWWVVRRVRPVALGGLAMAAVVLPTVGAIAYFKQPYTMATAIIPSLMSAYSLATLMHLYAGLQRAQAAGLRRANRLDRALSETLLPSAFNVLTTAAGLASLIFVPIPPVQVFGVAGAVGSVLVFIVNYVLVPPLLLRWDKHRWPAEGSGMGHLGRVASRIALTSMRYPRIVVVGTVVVLLGCVQLVRNVQAESDLLTFFSPRHEVVVTTRLAESALMGVTSIEVSLRGGDRDALQDVNRLRAMRDLQLWLEQQPEVDRTLSMADLVEEMHWAVNGEATAARTLPANNRQLRQLLLVYDGKDLHELVDRDFRHARVLVNLHVHGAREIGSFIERLRDRLAAHPIPGLNADVGGQGRLFADQVNLLVSGQLGSFAGAFLQIFLLMALLFRSFSAAAVCLVPNVAPLYFVFVVMGAAGIYLNMATVMIAGVVLGITVDDTIHLYHGYRERRHRGVSAVLAIARSFQSSGRAVLAISLLLVTQFLLLCGSDFVPTANFGLMTAVGLLAGQSFELLLLPALLLLKETGWRRKRPPVEAVQTGPPVSSAGAATMAGRMVPETPPGLGERRVLICTGHACMEAGGPDMLVRLAGLGPKHPTGAVARHRTLLTQCLGCCDAAPVVEVVVREHRFGRVSVRSLSEVLDQTWQSDRPERIAQEITAQSPPPSRQGVDGADTR